MVDLLDPQGAYFGGRVIAQGAPTAPDEAPGDAVVFKRLMQVGGGSGWQKVAAGGRAACMTLQMSRKA
jgi:hypothetical protein